MCLGLWLRLSQIVTDFLKIMEKEKEIKIDKHHLPLTDVFIYRNSKLSEIPHQVLYISSTHIELETGRLGILSLPTGALSNVSSNQY